MNRVATGVLWVTERTPGDQVASGRSCSWQKRLYYSSASRDRPCGPGKARPRERRCRLVHHVHRQSPLSTSPRDSRRITRAERFDADNIAASRRTPP